MKFNFKKKSKEDIYRNVRIDRLPTDVTSSIPYTNVFKNGVIETKKGTFTKQYKMKDANFSISQVEKQSSIFDAYQTFLNTFTDDFRWAITIHNHQIDKVQAMENIKIDPANDGLNSYRRELNQMYAQKMIAGTNNISQNKYLTVATDSKSVDDAMLKLNTVDEEIKKALKRITGAPLKDMSIEQRLNLLYDIYNQNSKYRFFNRRRDERLDFSLDDLEKSGVSSKDCVGPDSFDFKKRNMFILGESTYGQAFKLVSVPERLTSDFLADTTNLPFEMLVTLTHEPCPVDKTYELVRNQLVAIDAQVASVNQKNAEDGYGSVLPPDLERAQEKARELLDDIQSRDQKLTYITVTFVVFARSQDDLKARVAQLKQVCAKHQCPIRLAVYEQEETFNTALPLCLNQIYADRLYTTESAAVFVPYTSQDILQENALYYGVNASTKNLVLYNRLANKNYNGLVFGESGSGKSFACKLEMTSVLLKHPNSQVFVIDPENEYGDLCRALKGTQINIAAGSKHRINPLDMDMGYAEGEEGIVDPIPMKSQYIVSLIELMSHQNNGLSAQATSILDRCIRQMYKGYVEHMEKDRLPLGITCDEQKSPTLTTLYNLLRRQPEQEAHNLATIIEPYANGSFNIFSNKTNVSLDSKFVVYNINGLGAGLKDLGLQICLNDIWNRTIQNAKKGIYTWFYIDEFYLLLRSKESSNFLMEIWKRSRKWLGVPTGIMQNTEDLLSTREGRAILNNSSFIFMLPEPYQDRMNLMEMLNLSEDQLEYITEPDTDDEEDIGERTALLYNNKLALPIITNFPTNLSLFSLMNTTYGKGKKHDERTA